MSHVHLLAKIPWRHAIRFAPEIIEMAQKIYDNVKRTLGLKGTAVARGAGKGQLTLEDLDQRIERLESNEIQQAELIRNMARQVGELSTALRIVSKRLQLATALAFAALIGLILLAL